MPRTQVHMEKKHYQAYEGEEFNLFVQHHLPENAIIMWPIEIVEKDPLVSVNIHWRWNYEKEVKQKEAILTVMKNQNLA